jgi:hypothetical protein
MNNPLDRKMFRQAGMSKQPMGILASSPELMGAVKGYKNGGIQIPFYGQRKPQSKYNLGSIDDNLQLIQNEALKTEFGDAFGPKETKKVFGIEPNVAVPPKTNINDSTKKIIETSTDGDKDNLFNVKKVRPSFPGKKDSDTETTKSNVSADTLYGGVSKKIEDEAELIKVAYDKVNNNIANLKTAEFLGTTYNKEVAKQLELLRKEGKEFSIADAKKVAKEMGFSDPEELDKQYGEDREASFWLNMMKAGAAMAAGGSSNTLTNFAKGFTVGLEGYGKDTGELRKELRADKKEASKTIYNLLKDGRSEELAKRALDLQKSAAITNILKTEVGDEKERLTNEVNNEVANRKLTISLYKTFADMNFEAKKFNVSRDDFNKSIQMAYAKMMPDDLKILQAAGQITVIDPNKPLTPDNIKATPEGEKNIANILTKTFNGKITDSRFNQTTAGDRGVTSSGIDLKTGNDDYNSRLAGDAIVTYNKTRADTIKAAGGVETPMIANQDIQFAKVNNGKIDFSKQTNRMKQIFTDQSKGQSLVDLNSDIFINYTSQ